MHVWQTRTFDLDCCEVQVTVDCDVWRDSRGYHGDSSIEPTGKVFVEVRKDNIVSGAYLRSLDDAEIFLSRNLPPEVRDVSGTLLDQTIDEPDTWGQYNEREHDDV